MTTFSYIKNGLRYNIPVTLIEEPETLTFKFGYDEHVKDEVKAMTGARWVPNGKVWTALNNQHNKFRIRYLENPIGPKNPYARYNSKPPSQPIGLAPRFNHLAKKELLPHPHQAEFVDHLCERRQCILAAEMGTGKTLAVILHMETCLLGGGFDPGDAYTRSRDYWYVAPKSVLKTVQRELYAWGCKVFPVLMTYDELKRRMKTWVDGTKPPRYVAFDESSMAKTATSQRGQAAKALADGMRDDWGDEARIVLMTGTPAPRSPEDWYHQLEIACPGFIREGDSGKFKRRLGVVQTADNPMTGGKFAKLLTWKDDPRKCDVCGKLAEETVHILGFNEPGEHDFVPSKDEVNLLYRRMAGLVLIKFKKDCLNLPEKIYRTIELKPSKQLLRMAASVAKSSSTVIEGLTRLRSLSDGFQYDEKKVGEEECPSCKGSGQGIDHEEIADSCPNCNTAARQAYDALPEALKTEIDFDNCASHEPAYKEIPGRCSHCNGRKIVDKLERSTLEVECPKEEALVDLLEENEEQGRIVIFAGFTASIDRCVRICAKAGWVTIRLDGRGNLITGTDGQRLTLDFLTLFQDLKERYPKVAFVGHPGSGGFGHTLTAASMLVYYSNDFNGNNRTQSEDRIHRIGMDVNKGATIVDMLHLPSDRKVLDNLKEKRRLELLTMGELQAAIVDDNLIRD